MNERDIFIGVLEIDSSIDRQAFLDRACGDDSSLRERIHALLRAHEKGNSLLESPPVAALDATADTPPIAERPGQSIGRYKLREEIGEGGMGVVFMAEQRDPVRRKVALKIIKPGMDTREVIARFEAERQALALMDHPNIAKVLDGGATESGRPYFVMELVNGMPITEYCDKVSLPTRERLELFVLVCQAVQHAHQKGVIHRDLKPSNVMVTLYDGVPVPKIIDFGTAKALHQQLTEKSVFTGHGRMMGTPLYMSPEQAEMSALDVDTRSDIYSLGVLLYELLTGSTPFDRERLRAAGLDEVRRVIREEEPPRPSHRLSTLDAEAISTITAHRGVDARRLGSILRGDLDWIVMKALEKDRSRRYESASALAADIERYLANEPVEARPPRLADHAAKWARRHRPVVWSAVAVFTIAVAALATSVLLIAGAYGREKAGRKWADEQREIAQTQEALAKQQEALAKRQKELAEQQKQRAEANFAKARSAVDQFLNKVTEDQLLRVPGLQPLRRELLSSALKFYEEFVKERGDDPSLQADLASAQHRIGGIYGELGLADESKKANDQAVSLYEKLRQGGQESPDVLKGLADCYYFKGEYEKTIELCNKVLERKPLDVETRRLLGNAYNGLAVNPGKKPPEPVQQLKYHQQALAIREELVRSAPDDPVNLMELSGTLNNLGALLAEQGRIEDALAMYQRAAEYMEKAYSHAPNNPLYEKWLATAYGNIAGCQDQLGWKDEALKAAQRVVQVRRKLVVENPAIPELKSDLYAVYKALANLQRSMGKEQEALRSYRLAREILENLPRETPQDLYTLAAVYGSLAEAPKSDVSKPDAAAQSERAEYASQALDALKKAIAAGFTDTNALKNDKALASVRDREEFKKLLALLEVAAEADRLAQQATREENKLAARQKQADVERRLLELDPASLNYQATMAATLHAIGLIQLGLKQNDKAEKSLREALKIREAQHRQKPQDVALSYDHLATQVALGELYMHTERLPEGHKLLQETLRAIDDLAARQAGNAALQQQLAVLERMICDQYAQMGLWELAAVHSRRNLALKRMTDPTWDARFASLLAVLGDMDGHREYCRLLAEKQAKVDPGVIVWAAAVNPRPLPEPAKLFKLLDGKSDASDGFLRYARMLAMYRAGKHAEALDCLAASTATDWRTYPAIRALLSQTLGRPGVTEWLGESEQNYRRLVRSCLASPAPTDLATIVNQDGNWWLLAHFQIMHREAWEKIKGQKLVDDPWQRLIQARAYAKIGEKQKAEAEFAAAVKAAPDEWQVWAARAGVFADLGQHDRATADWQKAVELAGKDPMPWILRGRWYAERGEPKKADADFARAASLTPNELNKFLEAGWWMVGPYPKELATSCPPEHDPNPSRPVPTVDPKTGLLEKPVAWRRVDAGEFGAVDLKAAVHASSPSSAFAMAYVYSPVERSATLMVGGDEAVRAWVNGRVECEEAPRGSAWELRRIPVTLRAGGNTILARLTHTGGPASLTVRLADGPFDRAHTACFLWQWDEARRNFEAGFKEKWNSDISLSREYARLLAQTRDVEAYRQFCRQFRERYDHQTFDYGIFCLAEVCAWLPDPAIKPQQLVDWALRAQWPGDWEGVRKLVLGLAYYRNAQFREAKDCIEQNLQAMGMGQDGWPWLALAYFRLGDARTAGKWLEKCEEFNQQTLSQLRTSGVAYTPGTDLVFLIGLREAKEVIEGKPLDEDPSYRSLLEYVGKAAQAQDPKLADYDQAIAISPYDVAYWLARGRRLAELKRFDEAAADFNKAVALKPDDPQVRAARAAFQAGKTVRLDSTYAVFFVQRASVYVDCGELDKAEADLKRALQINPLCAQDSFKSAESYREKKQPERALREYRKAMWLDPQYTGAYFVHCGFVPKNKVGLDHALVDFRQLLRLRSDIPPAWLQWVSYWLPAMTCGTDKLPGIFFASDMPWVRSACGWGRPDAARVPKPFGRDLAGLPYTNGIGTHAFQDHTPADVVLDVAGHKFAAFKAQVGLLDHGSVQFQVLVDGKVKHETPVMHYGTVKPICLDVSGAKEIILRVLNGGDGNTGDSAGWGYARFIQAGAEDPLEIPPAQLQSATDANAAFFLAEVHWRLNQKDLARRWFDKAAAWMDKNKTEAEKLRPFRTEAAQLLGITAKAPTAKEKPQKTK